jgi:hypothetical protein
VIFALGLPFTVIGIILTAVGYTVTEGKQHIWYFEIVGLISTALPSYPFALNLGANYGNCLDLIYCSDAKSGT